MFGAFTSPQLSVATQVPIRAIEARSGLQLRPARERRSARRRQTNLSPAIRPAAVSARADPVPAVNDTGAAPSPEQVDALAKALTRALDLAALKRMVYLATGDELFEAYISPISTDPLRTMILNLLQTLSKDGSTERFLTVVYREKPLNKDVRTAIAGFCPAATGNAAQARGFQLKGGQEDASHPSGAGPGLQKNIKPALKSVDLTIWIDRIEQVRKQVCRVELSGTALGTGFLVGANAVLTNCHVVEEARKLGAIEQLGCRFDYRRLSNNTVDAGTVVAVQSIVDELPCSPAERTAEPDDPPPGPAISTTPCCSSIRFQAWGEGSSPWPVLRCKPARP